MKIAKSTGVFGNTNNVNLQLEEGKNLRNRLSSDSQQSWDIFA